jgi:hypothetical protein
MLRRAGTVLAVLSLPACGGDKTIATVAVAGAV